MHTTHDHRPEQYDKQAARRAVIGGAAGNFMVFYELFTYGYLAEESSRVVDGAV